YDLPGQTIYGPKSFLHTLVSKGSHLMVCCDTQKSLNNKWSSFGKLSYQISPSTSLSFMAMSTHSILDPGNIAGGGYIEQFAPPAGYTGSVPAGNYDGFGSYGLAQYNSAAQNADEVELKTSVGRGLVRLSYLSLTQLSDWYAGPGPLLRSTPVTLYGYLALTDVNTHVNTVQIANGLQAQLVNDFRYDYLSTEGRWRGWTAEYD